MRRHAALLALLAALAPGCSSTKAKGSGTTGGNDGGGTTGADGGGTTGGQLIPCTQTKDCTLGVCELAPGGKKYCKIQCTTDGDCTDPAAPMCNSRDQCVPRPVTTSSTSGTTTTSSTTTTTGVGPTSTSGTTTSTTTTGTTTGTTGTTTTSSTTGTTSSTTTGTTTSSTTTTSTSTTTGTTGTSGACIAGSCGSGMACNSATGQCQAATGSGALGSACSTFSDCASGHCESYNGTSYCTQPCSASGQCPANFVCINYGGSGECLNETTVYTGGNFSVGTGQVDSTCSTSNTNPTDCHSTYYCSSNTNGAGNNFCIDSCGQDFDCQGTSQATTDNFVCIEGPVTNGKAPYCWFVQSGGTCTDDSQCGNVTGACQSDPSGSGKHCAAGNACPNGDSDCSHFQCYTGSSTHFCTKPCCSYYDCPGTTSQLTCLPEQMQDGSGNTYVAKVCVDTPSGSTLTVGSACSPQSPNDCYTGLCLAYDANNPSSTNGYCTITCCTDTDCGSIAGAPARCVMHPNGYGGSMGVCEIE